MAKKPTVELQLWVHRETEGGILVSLDGDRNEAVWLPKALITVTEERLSKRMDVILEAQVPEHLAAEKGLI